MEGDATDERDGQLVVLIGCDMDAQEVGEVLHDDIVHPLIVEVVADEF